MLEEFKKIMCPVDFSTQSLIGVEKAAKLASYSKGELLLVHVMVDPWSDLYNPGADGLMDPMEAEKKATEMLEDLKAKYISGQKCQCLVLRSEHIYKGICKLAESSQSDVIVLSTHGRTGPKRLIMGSVAENTIRYAPCTVIVIK